MTQQDGVTEIADVQPANASRQMSAIFCGFK